MPGKVPEPWFRKSKKAWYVWIGGRLRSLGKDRDEAFRRFHLLMAGVEPEPGGKPKREMLPDPKSVQGRLTVRELVEKYLADGQRRLARSTFRVARDFARSFAEACGSLRAEGVQKHHVEAWIGRQGTWGATTEWDAKTRLVTLFRWGVDHGLLAANPIQGIRKPRVRSRGAEALVPPEAHAKLVEAASPALRDVLMALYQSGARPGEVITVTAREFVPEASVWVLTKHKTAHQGKPRIVHLTPGLVALCGELAARHPDGPLFRTSTGRPWCHTCHLAAQVRTLRRHLELPDTITPYGYRHSFATDALSSGVPDAQVAELLSHSGTAMLHKHYSHLTARARALKEALGRVR
jgi:integrase